MGVARGAGKLMPIGTTRSQARDRSWFSTTGSSSTRDLIAPLPGAPPGGWPGPTEQEPVLVRVLADIGVMRDEGEGIARIFDEMVGRRLPDIECQGGLFTIKLFGEGDGAA